MQRSAEEIKAALAQPFAAEDIEWRVQNANKESMRGLAVPFVTNRAIQNRLDETVGPENWTNSFTPWHTVSNKDGKKDSQLCAISIYFEGRGWVTKCDGAEDTDIEPVKGGLSDSMKRAAVHWGIGRCLYNMDNVWVAIEQRGRSFVIKDSERPKLDKAYLDMLKKLKLTPAPATGTQAQLTPAQIRENEQQSTPAELSKPKEPPKAQTPPVQEAPKAPAPPAREEKGAPKITTLPVSEPEYEYTVTGVSIQQGMSSKQTVLTLQNREGKAVKAFLRGVREELAAGVRLKNAKLTLRNQNNVAFYVLEGYEIASSVQQAA